jgi:putative ABC transport system permease protein
MRKPTGLTDDARHAVRSFSRDPFLAVAATLTLAICIGANTTVFSVAYSILIRPLPYPHADRIDWIAVRTGPAQQDLITAQEYFMLREQNGIFEDLGAFSSTNVTWTGVERPEQLDVGRVSASFFRVMGLQPMLGRYLTPDEEGPKAPPVAVLSYPFWRNRFGSDPHIVGKTISLDRLPCTIIGVMPQGFDFPHGSQMWLPQVLLDMATQSFPVAPNQPILTLPIVGLRRPGVTTIEAATEMRRLSLAARAAYPLEFRKVGVRQDLTMSAAPLQEHLTGPVRLALRVLRGAVGLVLLIACANIANLLLARASGRRRELAVRLALGSGRTRIIRQMLTESLVLAVPGGLAGIGLTWLAVRVLDAAKPGILVRYPAIVMDWRVLAFTLTLTLATSLIFGVLPALSASGINVQEALKSASLTHSAGRGAARLRKVLVIGELAVSLVLLIGAVLLARSFLHLAHTTLGFTSDHLLTFRIRPVALDFDRDYRSFYSDILSRVQQLPIVRSAAITEEIPLGADNFTADGAIRVIGRPVVPFAQRPRFKDSQVSPEFFQTLGIALRSGRIFDAHDFIGVSSARPSLLQKEAVVVNEAFVRRVFPGEDPLGRQLAFGPDEMNLIWTIVGVVSNIRSTSLGADPPATIYRCTCAGLPAFAGFLVRTSADPFAAVRAIEQQVNAVDRDQPISDVKTMDQRRDAVLAPERFQLALIGSFAIIAILLAAAGVYGTMSYLIARRTREIGIRMAMGARPADVLGMIFGETIILIVFAIAAGLAGAWVLTRYIRSMLYGVSELDPLTLALTSCLLAAIALFASAGPVLRAIDIDPMAALREE